MKLSWRDLATTILAIFGGAVVYAKFYDLSWWVISDNWRNAVAVLGITGLAMALVSGFNVLDRSLFNLAEIFLGLASIVVAVAGVIMSSPIMFYVLAASLGLLWLAEIGRHSWNSVGDEGAPRPTNVTHTYSR